MSDTKYKAKRFLLPILSLVLISIISIASINAYLTINIFKKHTQNHIEETKKEYIKKQQNEIYKNVHFVNSAIKFQVTKIENKLKASLKERVEIALDVTNIIYDTYKDTLNKEKIKEKISQALATIRFNQNRGYYFMYDNESKVLFGHPMKKFIGKNMTNFKDIRGQSLMQLDTKILKKSKIGYSKIYFNKPNEQKKEFPKITCITKFEPLNIVIGTGEYLDVIEKQLKEYLLDRMSNIKFNNKNTYLLLAELHDIKGGEEFATVLLNSNNPEEVGKKASANYKDVKGKEYRKNFLKDLSEKGESYTKYWYKKPLTGTPGLKMSYFYLQKDWNWIIASGFYYDDLENQISKMKESVEKYTKDTTNKALILVALLSSVAILIAIFVSFKIDKTIKNYTNKIIKFEENKREQDNLLIQQSKMASMGEMIDSIAHQWRQPLSIISTSSSGIKLQNELSMLDDELLRTSCDSITNSAKHLSNTIDDFRNFFKKDKIEKEFKIKDIFHKTTNLLISILKNTEIEIVEDIEDLTIKGFENELIQTFMNIINNAKDELELKDIRRMIFIDIHNIDNKVVINIKDNAGGIQENIIDKIFNSHVTTKGNRNGTGIGLHMTKRIIENSFKGTIEVSNIKFLYEDIDYSGANFKIIIPI